MKKSAELSSAVGYELNRGKTESIVKPKLSVINGIHNWLFPEDCLQIKPRIRFNSNKIAQVVLERVTRYVVAFNI